MVEFLFDKFLFLGRMEEIGGSKYGKETRCKIRFYNGKENS